MNDEQHGRPQNRGAHGEVILDVSRLRVYARKQMSLRIDAGHDEGFVPRKVVVFKIQVVIDQHGTKIGVITDAIAAHPRIHQRESQKEKEEKKFRVRRDCSGA